MALRIDSKMELEDQLKEQEKEKRKKKLNIFTHATVNELVT